jgi:hypothetical protein
MKIKLALTVVAIGLFVLATGCGKKAATINDTLLTNDTTVNEPIVNDLNTNEALNANLNTNSSEIFVYENTNTTVANTNTAVTPTNTNTNSGSTNTTGAITVTLPTTDQELTSPFYVTGTASGSQVYVRVKSGSGTTIFTEKVSVNSAGNFRGKLLFDFTHTTAGTVEVFAQDSSGNETDLVSVPVRFKTAAATNSNTNTTVDTNLNTNSTNSNVNS